MPDGPTSVAKYPDYARRVSDAVNLHVFLGNYGKWCAFRLSDGTSDGQLYDKRADAIRHQLHESQCAYIKIPRDLMSPRAAQSFMDMCRKIYDGGFRLQDPEDNRRPLGRHSLTYLSPLE